MPNKAKDIFSNGLQTIITALLISLLVTIFGNYTQTQANNSDIENLKKVAEDVSSMKDHFKDYVGTISSDVAVIKNNHIWLKEEMQGSQEDLKKEVLELRREIKELKEE